MWDQNGPFIFALSPRIILHIIIIIIYKYNYTLIRPRNISLHLSSECLSLNLDSSLSCIFPSFLNVSPSSLTPLLCMCVSLYSSSPLPLFLCLICLSLLLLFTSLLSALYTSLLLSLPPLFRMFIYLLLPPLRLSSLCLYLLLSSLSPLQGYEP